MQRVSRWLFIITACIALMLSGSVKTFAQNPVVHLSPKPSWLNSYQPYDKKPPLRNIQDGYFYSLAEHQIHVEKQADFRHYIREIVSNTGIQNGSQISVSFDPAFERLDFHEITIWRGNKPQNRLNLRDFKILADEQDFSKFIYQGSYSANFIISDIRKGDRIEYSYTVTGKNPIYENKFFKEIYFQGNLAYAHQYIAIVASPARKLNMKFFNDAPKPAIGQTGGLKSYVWEIFQSKPVIEDDTEPAWYNQYQHVQVSEYNSWGEVADWALKINEPAVNIKGSLADLISDLKHKYRNDKVGYFRAAVRTVQDEVRYMGIEIGEYSHRANRPEKVYDQRYGDCKDKSLLLVSMLRADGIDANMVLINSSINGHVDEFIPTPNAFDHAVVVATVNNKQIWVDATISNQGGDGTNIYFPNYGKGLILKPGNNSLSVVPVTKTGKFTCEEKYTIQDDTSKVRLDVKTVYTLDQADRQRDKLASNSMAETEKGYLDYYSKIYTKVDQKDSIQVIDDVHKNKLTTIESYWIHDFYKKDSVSNKSVADFYADYISQELPSVSNQTKTPVAVSYPDAIDYTIKVILPNGFDITNDQDSIKRDAYRFTSDFSAAGNTLSLHYQFAFLKDYVPANKLDEFRKDIKDLKDGKLSYSINHSNGAQPFAINIVMVVLALLVTGALVFLCIRIYRTETPGIVFTEGSTFVQIGGWLILILIGLALTPIFGLFTMFNGNYFSMSAWHLYGHGKENLIFKTLLVFEMSGNIILIGYSAFCLILLSNRRDILPKFIIGYFAYCTAFFIIDYLFAVSLNVDSGQALTAMIRAILIAAIWIPYFRVSTRVKETFIVPYPPENYSYEERQQ